MDTIDLHVPCKSEGRIEPRQSFSRLASLSAISHKNSVKEQQNKYLFDKTVFFGGKITSQAKEEEVVWTLPLLATV